MLFTNPNENIIRYENSILKLRREQLEVIGYNTTSRTLKKIFESLPKNFRKIFMYEVEYKKARQMCKEMFVERLRRCLVYSIEVLG